MNIRLSADSQGIAKVLAIALFVAPFGFSQQAYSLTHSDSSFLKDTAEGGVDEVKLGQLAMQNGASNQVKTFGQRMIDDHNKLNNELQALTSRKGETLPSDISLRQKASYKLLSEKQGDSFDKSYISAMVKDHQDDIAAFQKEANYGRDEDVKAFAAKALPTLQEHLRMAQHIAGELGVK